ncbi:hypothetical protein TNCV_4380201 [Trichonephila clavipes]|nr:hypothetical protein TNCV_4380201 [Trichonephila clavipes]
MAVIQFNKGFRELLDVLNQAQEQVGANTEKGFSLLDEERVSESKRHSLSEVQVLFPGWARWTQPFIPTVLGRYMSTNLAWGLNTGGLASD